MQAIVATASPDQIALVRRREAGIRARRAPSTAVCAAVAVAIHLALFFGVKVAAPGAAATQAVIPVALATIPAVATTDALPDEGAAPAPASRTETPQRMAELSGENAGQQVAFEEPGLGERRADAAPSAVPAARPSVVEPPRSPFAGATVRDLAQAIAANAASDTAHSSARPGLRVRRLGNVAPPSPDFAYYLNSWRRKVERIGQLNYPQQARTEGIGGSLRLLVVIAPDGALNDVRVLQTSGHKLLDDAALRIVRLAAPYAPFPPAMKATTDILEIERTWRFLDSRLSS